MTALPRTIDNTDGNTSKMHLALSLVVEILFHDAGAETMRAKQNDKNLSNSSILGCHTYPEGASNNTRPLKIQSDIISIWNGILPAVKEDVTRICEKYNMCFKLDCTDIGVSVTSIELIMKEIIKDNL